MTILRRAFLFFTTICFCGCTHRDVQERGLVTDHAMVVTAHPLASAVGAEILKRGGNAIDAAIAVQFALAVVYPDAGNIGGGGFLVLRQKDGSVDALDYREKAPGKASRTMYQNKEGEVIAGLSRKGHLAAGVPGTVAGMVQAHKKYGSMPWAALVQPAIDLAGRGFPLTPKEAQKLNEQRVNFLRYNVLKPTFVLKDHWNAGDTLRLQDLARTLERIRDRGRAGFYEGRTAALISAEMERGGGIISKADLAAYHAVWRKPITAQLKNFRVISMPPPSSGGIALVQLLTIAEDYPLKRWGWNTVESAHLLVEAERRVYADRAKYLGDPAYYQVPVAQLLDTTYIKSRMQNYDPEQATDSDAVSAGVPAPPENPHTTHYAIVDQAGSAVSVTTTLNSDFGSKVFVDGAGFLLNNEMDDFSIKAGYPNKYGLVGGDANAIAPNKRMLSSMAPTILEKNGKLYMVIGAMGGSTIITTVYQIILNVAVFDFPMQGAVNAGRFHHQWRPDWVLTEWGALGPLAGIGMWAMGHKVVPKPSGGIGRAAGILVLPNGSLEGGADPRGDDAAAGF